MSNWTLIQPMLHNSIDELLHQFLMEKYISNPKILGLSSFSINDLTRNSFEMVGDEFYCLYEKSYRLKNSNSFVNVKNYFHNNEFVSNGIDLTNGRLCTILSHFHKKYKTASLISSIELLLDDSLDYGSLIVNGFLDVRFGKSKKSKGKKKFHLIGISTDYELPLNSTAREINTHGARLMKGKLSFSRALEKFKDNPALKELATCVMEYFPYAAL